jgi:hypothetical protein
MPPLVSSFFPDKERNYFSHYLKEKIIKSFENDADIITVDDQLWNIDLYLKFPPLIQANEVEKKKYNYLLKILYLLKVSII